MPRGIYKRTKEQYLSRTGENHFRWKGDDVGYGALHDWIKSRLGNANHCEECNCKEIPKDKKRWFDWSNISGEYKRDLSDWEQLCIPCHRKKDGWNEKIIKKYIESKCWENKPRDRQGNFI